MQLRAIKKGYIDKDTESEEVAYKSGNKQFHGY